MISHNPFGSKKELKLFLIEVDKHFSKEEDRNLLSSSFKLIIFLKLMVEHNNNINHKRVINAAIYDSLNALVAIFNSRERYLQLNIRSLTEHIARIAIDKLDNKDSFDQNVKRQFFLDLKSKKPNENWKYIHETYIRACNYVHLSSKSKLNINSTFSDLLIGDSTSSKSKQISLFQKILSEIMSIFILYYKEEIENTFFRNKGELKFILGQKLFHSLNHETDI